MKEQYGILLDDSECGFPVGTLIKKVQHGYYAGDWEALYPTTGGKWGPTVIELHQTISPERIKFISKPSKKKIHLHRILMSL